MADADDNKVTLAVLSTDIKHLTTTVDGMGERVVARLDDHEARIRAAEQYKCPLEPRVQHLERTVWPTRIGAAIGATVAGAVAWVVGKMN